MLGEGLELIEMLGDGDGLGLDVRLEPNEGDTLRDTIGGTLTIGELNVDADDAIAELWIDDNLGLVKIEFNSDTIGLNEELYLLNDCIGLW